jgi:hypothetical protein
LIPFYEYFKELNNSDEDDDDDIDLNAVCNN